jgi:hypothetical protein
MADVIYLTVIGVFTVAAAGMVSFCHRLIRESIAEVVGTGPRADGGAR